MTINPSLYFLTFLVWRLVKLRDLVGQDARDRTAKTENPVYWSTFFSPKPNGNRLATLRLRSLRYALLLFVWPLVFEDSIKYLLFSVSKK